MKSPWQLGLLALAVTSISAYDVYFFQNRSRAALASHAVVQAGPERASALPRQDSEAPENGDSTPPISREGLGKLAMESYQSHVGPEEEALINQWPSRDPFSTPKEAPPKLSVIQETPVAPVKNEPVPNRASVLEPHCTYSGVLVQAGAKLALVDGEPLSIGDRLGEWQLVGIETEFITLKAGNESRRIALKGAESAARKDSL
jgi:hypothetical protein